MSLVGLLILLLVAAVAGVIAADSNNRIGIVGVAPEARLHIYKTCWQQDAGASCNTFTLAKGLAAAIDARVQIVNLSLGTQNPEHEPALTGVVKRLRESGAIVIAAGEQGGIRWLPGSIAGVWAVTLDWTVPRDSCRLDRLGAKGASFRATGFPRPIPGVPPAKNLKGLSFAVANVTGIIAKVIADDPAGDAAGSVTRAFERGFFS